MKHENYSIGYDILKAHTKLLHRLIYRRLIVSGLENIPEDTPIIFTPNHQNALMDAMAVLLTCPYQPTWLARADIFGNNFINAILKFLKMSPVYRIRDGKDNLGKNDEVFDLSIRVLKNNKALALFPEGMHTFKRQSAAHKKAVPRIAFMAEESENFELGIQIIPVGLYYSHYYQYNNQLMVTFGKPILLKDYAEVYVQNPGAAMFKLRDDIHDGLIPLTLNIKSKNFYESYETLREVFHNDHKLRFGPEELSADQKFIKKVEQWEQSNPEEASEFFAQTAEYRKLQIKHDLDDKAISAKPGWGKALVHGFLSLLGLPIFLYGFLNFFVGFYLPSILIRKNIRDKVFWATVEFVAWIFLIPLFSIIQAGLVWIFSGSFWAALLYIITLPLFGRFALSLYEQNKRTLRLFKIAKGGTDIEKMKNLRKKIGDFIKTHFSEKNNPDS